MNKYENQQKNINNPNNHYLDDSYSWDDFKKLNKIVKIEQELNRKINIIFYICKKYTEKAQRNFGNIGKRYRELTKKKCETL